MTKTPEITLEVSVKENPVLVDYIVGDELDFRVGKLLYVGCVESVQDDVLTFGLNEKVYVETEGGIIIE